MGSRVETCAVRCTFIKQYTPSCQFIGYTWLELMQAKEEAVVQRWWCLVSLTFMNSLFTCCQIGPV